MRLGVSGRVGYFLALASNITATMPVVTAADMLVPLSRRYSGVAMLLPATRSEGLPRNSVLFVAALPTIL